MSEFNMEISSLSDDEINELANREIELFNRIKENAMETLKELDKIKGEAPKTTNIKMSPLMKVVTVAKKIAKNAILSRITGIDPYFFDNDLSMLRSNSYESCMKCDLFTLGYSTTKDFIDGTDKVISALKGEKKKWMIEKINWFYGKLLTTFNDSYHMSDRKDYGIFLSTLFYAADIYDMGKFNKVRAMADRGVNINMTIDYYTELSHIFEDYYSKSNKIGR